MRYNVKDRRIRDQFLKNVKRDKKMDKQFTDEMIKIGASFGLPGSFFSCEELKKGNVNSTYLVKYSETDSSGKTCEKPYLFQKVNTYAFRQPVQLMENAEKITEHILKKHPGAVTLRYYHTECGGSRKNHLFVGEDFWRVMNYIPSVTFMSCDDTQIVRKAGIAFGEFQTALSDFDPAQLYYTIPGFHDTRKRYAYLKESARVDAAGRKNGIAIELDFLLSEEEKACLPTDLFNRGELPLRVTHNDTKINNVLFDEKTLEPLVVIDLDTVMPGIIASDFGDAIRYAANYTEEDCADLDKVGVDMNVFRAFADGFLSRTARELTETEKETLAHSCYSITCELAARFLADYLDGDKYFKIRYPEHNLVRARNQIALAKAMERNMDEMRSGVKELADRYGK